MRYRAFSLTAMVFVLAGCAAGGRSSGSGVFDPAPIRAAERDVIAALESPDPTAWVYMYTADAVFLESAGPPVEGRQTLLKMAAEMQPLSSVTLTPVRTVGHGDLAYVYCKASWINGRPLHAGTESRMLGVMIWHKEADGRWRIAHEVLVPEATGTQASQP